MKEKILMVFFTVVYFLIFCYFIDLVFRNTLSIYSDVLGNCIYYKQLHWLIIQ